MSQLQLRKAGYDKVFGVIEMDLMKHPQQDVQSLNQRSVRGRKEEMKNSPGEDWEAAGAVGA